MFHHYLVNRDNKELIKKIYLKHKEDTLRGDWYQTLSSDFISFNTPVDDDKKSQTLREHYRKMIKYQIEKAAFEHYLTLKQKSKKKMKDLGYDSFSIQPYLINGQFTMKQIKLLFSLRSKSYPAKTDFSKLHRGNLRCRLGCLEAETQTHIFENCEVLKSKVNYESKTSFNQIFGSVIEQNSPSSFLNI